MKQALGLVEISGLSTAVVVADTMAKAANIQILEIENTKGLGYMTIKLVGDVGAVKAAVDAGSQIGFINGRLVSSKVIPRPSDYVESTFCKCEPPERPTPPPPPSPVENQKEEKKANVQDNPESTEKSTEPEDREVIELAKTPESAEAPKTPEVSESEEVSEVSESSEVPESSEVSESTETSEKTEEPELQEDSDKSEDKTSKKPAKKTGGTKRK